MQIRQLVAAIAIFSGLTASAAMAEVIAVPFTGQLTDQNGLPLNGTFPLTFNIYYGASFQIAVIETVQVQNGIFHADLHVEEGYVVGDNRFIGIRKGSDPELSPRIPINYVPNAVYARLAERSGQADYALYANVAGSVQGGMFAGFNTNDIAPLQTISGTGMVVRDSVSIGVPGPGYVVVTCSATFSVDTIGEYLATMHLRDIRTTGSATGRDYKAGFVYAEGSADLYPASSTVTWSGVFPVAATIPGSRHTYYVLNETGILFLGNYSFPKVRMTAIYFPGRLDQPEQ